MGRLQCVICGWSIANKEGFVSWTNQFRGLCSSRDEGVYVTGVGLYSDPRLGRFIAPRNLGARWDDAGYANPDEDEFGALDMVVGKQEINGKRGFVFHDACWSLVKQAYHPVPIPCERLFEVLDSLVMTFARNGLDWEHDYGGLVILPNPKQVFPWLYPKFTETFVEHDVQTPYSVNPLANSEVEAILAETPQAPPSRDSLLSTKLSTSGRDLFTLLPEELRSAIATYLSTPDVLNARRASQSFWFVFDHQQFWASRFKGLASERSWLFEATHGFESPRRVRYRDWRGLYHRTADVRLSNGARNRKRIWGLIQQVADILALSWNGPAHEVPIPLQGSPKPPWIVVAGCIRRHNQYFSELVAYCVRFKAQRVAIPADGISQVAVSTVRLGEAGYICGLSFTATNGEAIQLGYNTTGSEHFLQLEGTALTGFNLAVGVGGIQALQCVSTSNTRRHLSAWVGFPNNVPITERLGRVTTRGQTMTLELGFDGFRIVSFAACRQPKQNIPAGRGVDDDGSNLRNSAIWYPHPPPSSVNLNEGFLIAPTMYTSGYWPLFWTWFGGPGGCFLTNLVKISFIRIGRIDFIFDSPEVPTGCRSFGRIRMEGLSREVKEKYYKPLDFLIDGPGGENIHKIELCHQGIKMHWGRREGYLVWLRIHTNRGRMWQVGRKPRAGNKESLKRVFSAAPGDAITGFYGYQYHNDIVSMGMITQPISSS